MDGSDLPEFPDAIKLCIIPPKLIEPKDDPLDFGGAEFVVTKVTGGSVFPPLVDPLPEPVPALLLFPVPLPLGGELPALLLP